jgi:hypothetical protein
VSPSVLDFSQQTVGIAGSQTLTLTNTGDTPLDVSNITISGTNPTEFDHDFTAPFTLNPGAAAIINVSFEPVSVGTKSAVLTIVHTGDNPAVTVTLSGEGVTDGGGSAVYRINAGGPAVTTGGVSWSANQYGSGATSTYTNVIAISGTSDDVLYQTETFGSSFSYNIPVTSGSYTVNLHFAEIYFGASGGGSGGAGSRIFDVDIENGQGTLSNYDIFAQVGAATAVVETFDNISVTDGFLNIAFSAIVNNAKISAIEVLTTAP